MLKPLGRHSSLVAPTPHGPFAADYTNTFQALARACPGGPEAAPQQPNNSSQAETPLPPELLRALGPLQQVGARLRVVWQLVARAVHGGCSTDSPEFLTHNYNCLHPTSCVRADTVSSTASP